MKHTLLFKAIVGSQSFGTSTPTSDIDYKGVYIQPIDDILGFKYKQQFEVSKDETYFEIRRYIELLMSANPTVLELLYSPEDCIIQTSPQFEELKKHRHLFLTKKCLHSFGGYARQQIVKARGLDKKMNYEKDRIVRKDITEFMYVSDGRGGSQALSKFLEFSGLSEFDICVSKLTNFKNVYTMYIQDGGFIGKDRNNIYTSSIQKGLKPLTILNFNLDGYQAHCKDYKSYVTWLENRNVERYVDVENHQQRIDGKNLLHCRRLLDMAKEIAEIGTLNVRRPNAEYLLDIRRGKYDLETILKDSEQDIESLDDIYKNSKLPDDVDSEFVNELLVKIRKM